MSTEKRKFNNARHRSAKWKAAGEMKIENSSAIIYEREEI
jgi:hypothetical protein